MDDVTDAKSKAGRLVERFILTTYRKPGEGSNDHLKTCPDVVVADPDAYDGEYGCDTGCEYVRFEAVITCPHGEREEFEWGEFNRLDDILKALEKNDPAV